MKPTRFHPRSLSLLRIRLHDTTTRKCHTVVHKHDIPRLLYRRENFILVRYPVTVSCKRRTTTGFDMKQPLGGLERQAHVHNFRQSKIASHCKFQRVTKMGSHILRILDWEKPGKRRFRNGQIRVFKSDRKWINWDCQKLHLPKN